MYLMIYHKKIQGLHRDESGHYDDERVVPIALSNYPMSIPNYSC